METSARCCEPASKPSLRLALALGSAVLWERGSLTSLELEELFLLELGLRVSFLTLLLLRLSSPLLAALGFACLLLVLMVVEGEEEGFEMPSVRRRSARFGRRSDEGDGGADLAYSKNILFNARRDCEKIREKEIP
jgi:hypothetical protein